MPNLKANVADIVESNKKVSSFRKESGFYREIAAIDPKTGHSVVTARIYWPGATAYCVLWVSGKEVYGRGCGKAGGYGYDKASSALQSAILDAGIYLTGDVYGNDPAKNGRPAYIGGVGNSAMLAAVEAIAVAVTGKRKFIIHEAHA